MFSLRGTCHEALQSVSSGDPEKVKMGKEVLVFIHLKTILSAVDLMSDLYNLDNDAERKDDFVQSAIANVHDKLSDFGKAKKSSSKSSQITVYIHRQAIWGIAEDIGTSKNIPPTWVKEKNDSVVDQAIGKIGGDSAFARITVEQLEQIAGELTEETKLGLASIMDYLNYRASQVLENTFLDPEELGIQSATKDEILKLMRRVLKPRELKVLYIRYFDGMKYEEIADIFNLTRQRIRQIELNALNRLRISGYIFKLQVTDHF